MPFLNCNYKLFWLGLIIIITITGCKKLVDPGSPSDRITAATTYNSDSTAMAAVNGIYSEMMKSFGPMNGYMTRLCSIYADELNKAIPFDKDDPFLNNALQADDAVVQQMWTLFYRYIYLSNDAIQGLAGSTGVSTGLRSQLSGEAYFIRALCYFYLVNLFGDVPLITGTNYNANSKIGRTPASQVYDQMISDLKEAQNMLSLLYFTPKDNSTQRVRANQGAATALLARVYLYKKDWAAAEAAATQVIQLPIYKLETDLQQIFSSASQEAILQFMPFTGANSAEAAMFIPQSGNIPAFIIRDSLLATIDPNDKRWQWIKTVPIGGTSYTYPVKYRLNDGQTYTEYEMVLRLAEQFLIRAEARIMQNNLGGAADDVNMLRTRAGLAAAGPYNSPTEAMASLENERRIELFAEWGQRWFDLKRWPPRTSQPGFNTRADEVLSSLKPANWKPTAVWWPIPVREIDLNPFLTQNQGY